MERPGHRITVRLAAAALVIGGIAFATQWITGGLEEGRFVNDYRVFRAAGQLAAQGDLSGLYDRAELGALAFGSGGAVFLNPPPWAFVFVPLAALPMAVGAAVWLSAGILVMVVGLRAVGVRWAWIALVLASLPALLTVELGQSAFLSAGLVGSAAWALREDRAMPAALALIALFYKPHFAVGLAVVGLFLTPRTRRASWTAIGGWAALAGLSLLLVPSFPSSWLDNVSFLRAAALQHESSAVALFSAIGPGVLRTTAGWIIGGAGAVALVLVARSSAPPSLRIAAGAAFGAWISPHLLIYDWLVLAVPVALVAASGHEKTGLSAGAVLAVSALVAAPLESLQLRLFGGWIGVASLALIITSAWVGAQVLGQKAGAAATT